MKITKDNIHEVTFENHDAYLLIKHLVTQTPACIYYYHDQEFSLRKALDIWNRTVESERMYEFRIAV